MPQAPTLPAVDLTPRSGGTASAAPPSSTTGDMPVAPPTPSSAPGAPTAPVSSVPTADQVPPVGPLDPAGPGATQGSVAPAPSDALNEVDTQVAEGGESGEGTDAPEPSAS